MRPNRRHLRPTVRFALAAALVAAAATASAADLPPEVVASFTRRVQPLVLNRCATGACHGGPESPAPRFHRGPDRVHTLANLAALLQSVGPDRDPRRLAALLAAGHPEAAPSPSRRATPLSKAERITLDGWLAEVRDAERFAPPADRGVVPVAAEIAEPIPPRPNRLRAILDDAANPPTLPPPEQPKGVIFKNDEPPAE